MFYLMIKKAYPTGLMYLCYTKQEPYSYKGSGKRWENHIKFHNPLIVTCVIGEYETMEEIRENGIKWSKELDVVRSNQWANLREEDGLGGGSGKVGRRWKIKDTSNMRGPKFIDKTTEEYAARIKNLRDRMTGENNPRKRLVATEKQIATWSKQISVATEASKKKVSALFPDGTTKHFESKRALCHNIGISYDILNYRIDTDRDYNGIKFKTEK